MAERRDGSATTTDDRSGQETRGDGPAKEFVAELEIEQHPIVRSQGIY